MTRKISKFADDGAVELTGRAAQEALLSRLGKLGVSFSGPAQGMAVTTLKAILKAVEADPAAAVEQFSEHYRKGRNASERSATHSALDYARKRNEQTRRADERFGA